MKRNNIIIVAIVLMFCVGSLTSSELMAANAPAKNAKPVATEQKTDAKQVQKTATTATTEPVKHTYITVKPLDLVANPNTYLNKRVKITGKFDKFSSLGLDYNAALRSSEKYITFLIRRDDVSNDIPLSELKNFMKRETAEKFIDLETDDVVEYSGFVFSNALGDVWLEVEDFKVVSSKNSPKSK